MAEYLMYHINRSSLARDIISPVDSYTKKEVSEEMLQNYVRSWGEKCPNLLFDADTKNPDSLNRDAISQKLIRRIGKKRSIIVLTVLKETGI